MGFAEFVVGAVIILGILNGIYTAIHEIKTGEDTRTPEQRLMDTTISDNVTRIGSVLDAVNAQARGRKPTTRM